MFVGISVGSLSLILIIYYPSSILAAAVAAITGFLLAIFFVSRTNRVRSSDDERRKEALAQKYVSDSIINSLPGVFYLYDRNGKFIRWNKNFETVTGYSGKEIATMHPLQFLGDVQLSRSKIESVFQKGIDELETDFLTKDGRKIPYYFNGSLILLDGVEFLIGMGIDLSARKQAEQQVLSVYKEKETTLNRISDAVISLDTNWCYTFMNDAALSTHPEGREGTLGRHLLEVHPQLEATVFWTNYQEAARTMTVREFESFYAPMNIWFSVKVYPSGDGLTIFYNNITARKRTEQEMLLLIDSLQAKNKDLQQFSYIVSHNLRSPIAKIAGLINIIGDDAEENKMLVDLIKKEVSHLDEVVKDISAIVYARKSQADQKETISIEDQLSGVRQALSVEILESNTIIKTDFSKAQEVVTIKSFLYSILYNLLSNAIKYRRPDVPLEVRIESFDFPDSVCISVSDNGRGIDLKVHEGNLFRLYKRFHDKEIPGRGVGLNLVKTHVESLGGRIEVESEVGKGSVFKVYLSK